MHSTWLLITIDRGPKPVVIIRHSGVCVGEPSVWRMREWKRIICGKFRENIARETYCAHGTPKFTTPTSLPFNVNGPPESPWKRNQFSLNGPHLTNFIAFTHIARSFAFFGQRTNVSNVNIWIGSISCRTLFVADRFQFDDLQFVRMHCTITPSGFKRRKMKWIFSCWIQRRQNYTDSIAMWYSLAPHTVNIRSVAPICWIAPFRWFESAQYR